MFIHFASFMRLKFKPVAVVLIKTRLKVRIPIPKNKSGVEIPF